MRRAAGPLVVLLLLASCGGGDDDGQASSSTAEEATTTTEAPEGDLEGAPEVVLPADAPVVEVIDPGAEPRRELRFEPSVGDKQQLTMRQEQTQTVEVGGVVQSFSTITEMDIAYFIEDVAGGVIETRVVYEDTRIVEADAAVRGTLEDVMEAFVGTEGRSTFDTRGYLLDAELPDLDLGGIPGAEQFLTGLEDQLTALAAPFPDEPVGEGARWTVTTSAEFGGILVADSTFTIELTTADDEEVAAAIDIAMTFSSAGGVLEVESSDLTGEGTLLWPVDGVTALFDQTIEGTVVFTSQGQRVTQTQLQRVVMTPR